MFVRKAPFLCYHDSFALSVATPRCWPLPHPMVVYKFTSWPQGSLLLFPPGRPMITRPGSQLSITGTPMLFSQVVWLPSYLKICPKSPTVRKFLTDMLLPFLFLIVLVKISTFLICMELYFYFFESKGVQMIFLLCMVWPVQILKKPLYMYINL